MKKCGSIFEKKKSLKIARIHWNEWNPIQGSTPDCFWPRMYRMVRFGISVSILFENSQYMQHCQLFATHQIWRKMAKPLEKRILWRAAANSVVLYASYSISIFNFLIIAPPKFDPIKFLRGGSKISGDKKGYTSSSTLVSNNNRIVYVCSDCSSPETNRKRSDNRVQTGVETGMSIAMTTTGQKEDVGNDGESNSKI